MSRSSWPADRVRCSSLRPMSPAARDILGEVDPGEPTPQSGAERPSRVLAGVLIAVALVALVVCLATDVVI